MPELIELVVSPDDAGKRLDAYVAANIEALSRSRVHKLIEAGHILVSGKQQPPRYSVRAGEAIQVTVPDPEAAEPVGENIPLEIVYEDDDLIVVNKPAGLVVHPGAGISSGTLVNALLGRPGSLSSIGGVARPGIVHRLDKDTSGLLIVAKNDFSHRALSRALSERTIHRTYLGICMRKFPERSGVVEGDIGRHPTIRTRMAVVRSGGRSARTHWKVLEDYGNFSLLECKLESGRTHQIRVHLSHIHHPVVGDAIYGGGNVAAIHLVDPRDQALKVAITRVKRQMLHACELEFAHPRTGEPLHFKAAAPADISSLLTALRGENKQGRPVTTRHGKKA